MGDAGTTIPDANYLEWKEKHPELLQPGVLVLIKDKNLRPLKWAMDRVMEVHKGADGVARVVTLKTAQGVFKTPASKLCIINLII
ncbi:hypothetical protein NQ317_013634 [Molorchus minor]|uniref:DUF5641 domain-containing protein n=1 Tax=Molorchus minor TaxID=1323400 RepID=A0ABQ9JX49_9CUCU|nr:hypothetical protein NQ317_013634 [Molorchus minor]